MKTVDLPVDRAVLDVALKTYGVQRQVDKAVEEMAELTAKLMQSRERPEISTHVPEEVADVLVMALQLRELIGPKLVDLHIRGKMERLRGRLQEELMEAQRKK